MRGGFGSGGSGGALGQGGLQALLGVLGQLLATGAVFKLQLDAYLGRPHDMEESFAFARGKILSLLWLGIVSTVLIAIGFVLLILPGIWLLVSFSVAVPVLMLLDTPKSTTQLVALTGLGLGSVGRHLKILLDAGLVQRRRAGRSVLYSLTRAGRTVVNAGAGARSSAPAAQTAVSAGARR